jgi:hypothetical protein
MSLPSIYHAFLEDATSSMEPPLGGGMNAMPERRVGRAVLIILV